jgi:hypothetical protein
MGMILVLPCYTPGRTGNGATSDAMPDRERRSTHTGQLQLRMIDFSLYRN